MANAVLKLSANVTARVFPGSLRTTPKLQNPRGQTNVFQPVTNDPSMMLNVKSWNVSSKPGNERTARRKVGNKIR
jgi:hypothetical protein